MKILLTAKADARSNFAAQHMAAAEYFLAKAAAAETTLPPSKDVLPPPEYMHCWFASVVFAGDGA